MPHDFDHCKAVLTQYKQEHLLRFWAELNEAERSNLLEEISEIDFAKISKYWAACQAELNGTVEKVDSRLQPVPEQVCASFQNSTADELNRYYEIGLEQIANNRVACLLLAGGQGTRLGVTYPKGMYKVGLPSEKTLYEIQADRIKKVTSLAAARFQKDCVVPWYIMTSEHTQTETQRFFEEHAHFGIDERNIRMFEQYTLPAFTREGKCILETRSRVSLAPDGNGGLYRALDRHGIIKDMKARGVQYVFVYCVDNILVKMADPHFIGFAVHRNAECANKVVAKTEPTESVGVVGILDGRCSVIEYSEITLETASKRRDSSNGQLLFNAGNICNHFFTVEFLERIVAEHADSLHHHVAYKKVPHVDENGTLVKPTTPNGIKLERFVFDVFQFVSDDRFAVWEVRREDEFAPLKNAEAPRAVDSPSTCRSALLFRQARELLAAGASIAYRVASDADKANACTKRAGKWKILDPDALQDSASLRKLCETGAIAVEIDASLSYFGEGLESASGHLIKSPAYIRFPFEAAH